MGLMAWLQSVLSKEFWAGLGVGGVAIGSVALSLVRYYAKKRIDKSLDEDPYRDYGKAIALHREMSSLDVSIEEIQKLMSVVEGKPAQVAVMNAQYYSSRAKQLVHSQLHLTSVDPMPAEATQLEMNMHAAGRYQQAKAVLEQVWASYLTSSMEHEREAVSAAQDAWKAWLAAEGERESARWKGGSIEQMMVNARLEALTRERITSLELDFGDAQSQGGREIVIERSYTPSNFLDHVRQGAPIERIRSLLGVPTSIEGNTWKYRYVDTEAQIRVNEGVVEQASLLLIDGQKYRGTGAAWGSFVLGELTLGEIADDWVAEPNFFTSMRTTEVYFRVRCGPAGAWEESTVGALMVFSGAGMLADVELDWDYENQTMKDGWRSVLVNYISNGPDEGPALVDWFVAA